MANRLLRRVRDYAAVKGDGIIETAITCEALEAEGIDSAGLDPLDRKLLKVVIEYYNGGPVGIEALGATLNEVVDTRVVMVEPLRLRSRYIHRTNPCRRASDPAGAHLGL